MDDDYEATMMQEAYDEMFPPMPDWIETELEARRRPEGY